MNNYSLISANKVFNILKEHEGENIYLRRGYAFRGAEEHLVANDENLTHTIRRAAASDVTVKEDGVHINCFSYLDLE